MPEKHNPGDDIQSLVDQAMAEAVGTPEGEGEGGATTEVADAAPTPEQSPAPPAASDDSASATGIELLSDVELHVKIELGRTRMLVEDVLRLGGGSVVELDKLAGDPVDVYVNDQLVARGEVLVLNDNFCIRISEIMANLEKRGEMVAEAAGA